MALLLLASAVPAWCGPAPTAPPEAVLQTPGDSYDFGSRSALDPSPITHTFVLTAGAKAAVTVDRLQPSCHCTQADPVGGTDGYGRFTVAAGRSVSVVVTVNPSDMAPGPVEKEVFVFANGHSTPDTTLHIRGLITPPVVFSVPKLDFGRVPAGETRTLPVIVTYDPRLLSSGQTAMLTCSDPHLRLTRDNSTPSASATPMRTMKYRITLPVGITGGKLSAILSLALVPDTGGPAPGWSIPLCGEIVAPAARR